MRYNYLLAINGISFAMWHIQPDVSTFDLQKPKAIVSITSVTLMSIIFCYSQINNTIPQEFVYWNAFTLDY